MPSSTARTREDFTLQTKIKDVFSEVEVTLLPWYHAMTIPGVLGLLPLRNSNETLAELRPRNLIKVTPQKGFHPLVKRKTVTTK